MKPHRYGVVFDGMSHPISKVRMIPASTRHIRTPQHAKLATHIPFLTSAVLGGVSTILLPVRDRTVWAQFLYV